MDRELKRACEDLIRLCAQSASAPIISFLSECTAYLSSRPPASADLSSQAFATPDKVKEVHDLFKSTAAQRVNEWVDHLRVYLQDEETVGVLVPPAQGSIVDRYRQFHDLVRAEYDFSTAAALLTPAGVQNMLSSGQGAKE